MGTQAFIAGVSLAVLTALTGAQEAAADVFCKKKSGSVVVRPGSACKRREVLLDLAGFGAKGDKGDKGDTGDQGVPGLPGASGNNSLVGFANITGGVSPVVRSFGGQGTTSVTLNRVAAGTYDVTFHGNYPNATDRDAISSFATVDTDNFDFASTSLDTSTAPTTSAITIRVFTFSVGGGAPPTIEDRDVAVAVLVP